jgi:tRNA pseudouridine32 synthase/23S rRNA pseudouridine746 synthase
MRELPASKCFQTIHYNSETWIDLIELLEDNDSEAPTREIPKRALARYTLKPVTGHRHQLRLHMSALGLPMLSDQFYPFVRRSSMDEEDFKEPLQLLAKKIAFTDPLTGDKREFKSKLKLRY